MSDDSYGLDGERFEECVNVYTRPSPLPKAILSQSLSSHFLMITISLGYSTYPSWSPLNHYFLFQCLHVIFPGVLSDIFTIAHFTSILFLYSLFPCMATVLVPFMVCSLWGHKSWYQVFLFPHSHIALYNGL